MNTRSGARARTPANALEAENADLRRRLEEAEETLQAIGSGAVDAFQKHQAELAAAHELLEESNRVKDEFLATLSHELRTPLHAILGWAHLLGERALSLDAQQRAIEVIRRNAKAQAQLVEDLLDISRIVSDKLQLEQDAVDLGSVITSAVETHRLTAKSKRIRLVVTTPPDVDILVQGDAERLEQVVWNLLSNAIKFTPANGHVEVELRARESTAEIVVNDTGQGIGADFLPLMFQRFRQADSSSARTHGGLGLGLAIVRHVTEAHGGTVLATSLGEGHGATFTVQLPIKTVQPKSNATSPVLDRQPSLLSTARVLVIDDEADARDLMRAMLESRGAEVATAASADEALRALRHRSFDVLFCDIAMPGQNGYALIHAVRTLPADMGGRVPAVAVTAYASLPERDAAIEAGYDWHLAKPIDLEELAGSVTRALSLSRQR